MAFEDWFVARARVSSKPHRKITLDDKISFFSSFPRWSPPARRCCRRCRSAASRARASNCGGPGTDGGSRRRRQLGPRRRGQFSQRLPPHWIEVLRTGEITGQMAHGAGGTQQADPRGPETRRKVKGAMMYPIILICFAIGAVTAMLWFVVPTFAGMFKDLGAELPGITQFVVDPSGFVVHYGLYILLGLIVVALGIRQFGKTERGRRLFIGVGLACPWWVTSLSSRRCIASPRISRYC